MNESNLENYRSAWRQEQSFGTRSLGRDEINSVLKKESKSMVQQFRTGLVLDMVIKGLLALALAGVLFLVPASAKLSSLNAAVLALTLFLIFLQSITLHQVPRPSVIGDNLRNYLREITWFYRKRFVGALYVAAVSGSLVFYVGALYYVWLKYGGLRPLDREDYLVFGIGLALAFAINAAAQLWQSGFHMRELEACLDEIDLEGLAEHQVRKRRFRRQKINMMWLMWLVLGLLVLIWFLARQPVM
jgi:hypothetical protein